MLSLFMLAQDGEMLDQCSTKARDMLVHRDSSLARCPFWFVACPPMVLANAEMLDMQSALQQRKDSTVGRELT